MAESKGKIIAFTGAHGTGKTTSVYEMAASLKKSCPYEIGLITEVARNCPIPVFGKNTAGQDFMQAQMWIFATQLKMEIDFVNRFEVIVTDRTIVDAIAYTFFLGYEDLAACQLEMARHHVHMYDRIYLKKAGAPPEFLVDDEFRNIDTIDQHTIEATLLWAYMELGIHIIEDVSVLQGEGDSK